LTAKPARPRGDICPSCDRFIGTRTVCPYCDADSAKTPLMRYLRTAALCLAVVGLGLLYLMSTRREIPLTPIADITPTMNFAYIRIAGTVARAPYVSGKQGALDYLSFAVDDGTGELRVAAYREAARALEAQGRVPRRGASVDVAGSLRVPADGRRKLTLQVPGHLKIGKEKGPE